MKYQSPFRSAFLISALLGSVSGAAAQVQMIAEITEDITTGFGTYHPYPAVFHPELPAFHVEPDFSNVQFTPSDLSPANSALLLENHVAVRKSLYTQIYDIYAQCTDESLPVFITTDAVLDAYHVLCDRFLEKTEKMSLYGKLDLLTEYLLGETGALGPVILILPEN